MKCLLSILIKRLFNGLSNVINFLSRHGFFDAIVENSVKLVFFIIVFYIFGKVVW